MAKQKVTFERAGRDTDDRGTGIEGQKATQPIIDGERAIAAVVNRPGDNLRLRTEVLRSQQEDNLYRQDADLSLLGTPGNVAGAAAELDIPLITWDKTAGTFSIDNPIVIQPLNTPKEDIYEDVTYTFDGGSGTGTGTLKFELLDNMEEKANLLTITWQNNSTVDLAVDITGYPKRDVTITVKDDGTTTIEDVVSMLGSIADAGLNAVTTGDVTATIDLATDFGSGTSNPDLVFEFTKTYMRELHRLSAATLTTWFSSNDPLADGDTLAIQFVDLATRKAAHSSSAGGVVNLTPGDLFVTSRHSERIPVSLPLCKRIGDLLYWFDGTVCGAEAVYLSENGLTVQRILDILSTDTIITGDWDFQGTLRPITIDASQPYAHQVIPTPDYYGVNVVMKPLGVYSGGPAKTLGALKYDLDLSSLAGVDPHFKVLLDNKTLDVGTFSGTVSQVIGSSLALEFSSSSINHYVNILMASEVVMDFTNSNVGAAFFNYNFINALNESTYSFRFSDNSATYIGAGRDLNSYRLHSNYLEITPSTSSNMSLFRLNENKVQLSALYSEVNYPLATSATMYYSEFLLRGMNNTNQKLIIGPASASEWYNNTLTTTKYETTINKYTTLQNADIIGGLFTVDVEAHESGIDRSNSHVVGLKAMVSSKYVDTTTASALPYMVGIQSRVVLLDSLITTGAAAMFAETKAESINFLGINYDTEPTYAAVLELRKSISGLFGKVTPFGNNAVYTLGTINFSGYLTNNKPENLTIIQSYVTRLDTKYYSTLQLHVASGVVPTNQYLSSVDITRDGIFLHGTTGIIGTIPANPTLHLARTNVNSVCYTPALIDIREESQDIEHPDRVIFVNTDNTDDHTIGKIKATHAGMFVTIVNQGVRGIKFSNSISNAANVSLGVGDSITLVTTRLFGDFGTWSVIGASDGVVFP